MITLAEITTRIAECEEELKLDPLNKQIRKRRDHYSLIKTYLETWPNMWYLTNTRNDIMKKLDAIEERRPLPNTRNPVGSDAWKDDLKNPVYKKRLAQHYNDYNRSVLKNQLKALNFILTGSGIVTPSKN